MVRQVLRVPRRIEWLLAYLERGVIHPANTQNLDCLLVIPMHLPTLDERLYFHTQTKFARPHQLHWKGQYSA